MDRALRRSLGDRILGGVCGGLGRYFDIDSALVRLGWVLFTLMGGSGVLAYLLAWLIIPDEAGERSPVAISLFILFFVLPILCLLCLAPFILGTALLGAIANN